MPTVLRVDGFRLYFWSHEPNEPAHVHIDRGGATAKVWLQPVAIAGSAGYRARELAELLRLVGDHRELLLGAWNEFFDAGRSG